jgi:hypothetical protein
MRASDLLGKTVRDASGRSREVIGIRAVQDGSLPDCPAALRVDAVIVSSRYAGAYLGYTNDRQRGPWALAALLRRLHRHAEVLPWATVQSQLLAPSYLSDEH